MSAHIIHHPPLATRRLCSCAREMYRNLPGGKQERQIMGKITCMVCRGSGWKAHCTACSGCGLGPGGVLCRPCAATGWVPA